MPTRYVATGYFFAAVFPPLRPAFFFCAVVPPWELLPLPEWLFSPPCLDAFGEFAIFAARSFDIPLSLRASYCFSFFTFAGIVGLLSPGVGRPVGTRISRRHSGSRRRCPCRASGRS